MNNDERALLGSSYYPERWERQRWPVDAELMQKAGFSFIRTGEFAWSKFEASEGKYDFSWMDDAIEVFGKQGIKTIMCTPTAAPVPWITAKHPDTLPITEEGKPFVPGQRRHYCFNNVNYRKYTERIVREMAKHYESNPNIMGWQIDNELGGEEFICCCENCRMSFQHWLKNKYKTLEELNRRWGGTFFSFEFNDWNEIPVPLGHNVKYFNPTFKKDYLHFYSDSMKDYLYFQVKLLREYIKDMPITTNRFTLFWVDKYDHLMDQELDAVAFDNYDQEPSLAAFHHDFYRAIKTDRKHWVLEQSAGLRRFGDNQKEILLQTVQSVAKGAELICYFSWRQINYGCEQDLYGVVAHDGTAGETYEILKKTNEWLNGKGKVLMGLKQKNEIAIIHSYESSLIYYSNLSLGSTNYHKELYENFYTPVFELGIGVDFIPSFEEILKYKIIIISLHVLENKEAINKLKTYVVNGGTAILTGDFMQKSTDNWRVYSDTLEQIDELTGIKHEKIFYMNNQSEGEIISIISDKCHKVHGFFNKFDISDNNINIIAKVVSPHNEKGVPAIIERTLGKGKLIFMAALSTKDMVKEIVKKYSLEYNIEVLDLPERVEVIRLFDSTEEFTAYLIINKSIQDVSLVLRYIKNPVEVKSGDYRLIEL